MIILEFTPTRPGFLARVLNTRHLFTTIVVQLDSAHSGKQKPFYLVKRL